MPRGETKFRPDLFVMDYIKTLGITDNKHVGKEGRDMTPPSTCPAKNALLWFMVEGRRRVHGIILFPA